MFRVAGINYLGVGEMVDRSFYHKLINPNIDVIQEHREGKEQRKRLT